jgi:hypothetical protein
MEKLYIFYVRAVVSVVYGIAALIKAEYRAQRCLLNHCHRVLDHAKLNHRRGP